MAQLITVVVVELDRSRALRYVENMTALTINMPPNAMHCTARPTWHHRNREAWMERVHLRVSVSTQYCSVYQLCENYD